MTPTQREAALRLARTPISQRDLQWHGETATLLRELAQEPQAEPEERYLRRLLALRVAMPNTYYDDGEAQGLEHGIAIDFMREPVADIDAKLRALAVARAECAHPPQQRKPLNFDQLQRVMQQHFGAQELTDEEADSAEEFARAIERAHGITVAP